jgi:hypothetical protein
MRNFLFAVLSIAGVISVPAFAANADVSLLTLPPCDGEFSIVRISAIRPTGSIEGFMKAVEAQKAWYRSHGYKDNKIYTRKIFILDPVSGKWQYADKEVMVIHVRPPQSVERDAAWRAFVKQYRDNSQIERAYFTCATKEQ